MNITTEQIFDHARTQNGFFADPVPEAKVRALYEMMKWGPTSANCSPARFIFVQSREAKDKLIDCMDPGNVAKVRSAPVTAIIGMDMAFYDKLPQLGRVLPNGKFFKKYPFPRNECLARENAGAGVPGCTDDPGF